MVARNAVTGVAQRRRLGTARAVTVFLVTAATLFAGDISPAKIAQIRRLIAGEMARQHIPGMSIAIATDHELRWSEGFGFADLEDLAPAQASTLFRLGSICKPITAVAVMQLVERKKVDLDASIRTYVPSFPRKQWRITARQLLAHQSGIRHYSSAAEVANTRHYTNLLDSLAVFRNDPLLFEPGTWFLYSSYGFTLLGAAVEGASGMRFVDYVHANIAQPAGMTGLQLDDVYTIIPHRARGYRLRTGGKVENCALADTSNRIPAGGFLATAEDLVRFALAVEGGVLVTKETARQMFTPQKIRDGRLTNYGLGWQIIERGGRKWVLHSGRQPGARTVLLLPSEGTVIAVLTNLEQADPEKIAAGVAEALR